ncbi:MAG TPA: DinB family protein [Candidatus Nanoarchaeia archaeon]|nr:DinB family protein [Candidatus Nanoarchaeia archaeon]
MSEKEQFLSTREQEFKTTLKVLKAYPQHRQNFKPHEISMSAKDLAWLFAAEESVVIPGVIAGNIEWNKMPKAPETMEEAISELEKVHHKMTQTLKDTPEESLKGTMEFMVAPKTMGLVPKMQVLWMILMDQIHHRGQFSVYLRMAGGKVPSIYGPSADEPW